MCLQAVAHGLACTYNNFGLGGMASVFQLMEIAHTHYWSKDLSEGAFEGPLMLQATSYGSYDSLRSHPSSKQSDYGEVTRKLSSQDPSQVRLEISHATTTPANTDNNQSTTDLFLDMFSKKGKLLSKLASFDSEVSYCTFARMNNQ